MHTIPDSQIFFIVLTVLLVMVLGTVMVILIDHKSRIPGALQHSLFGIEGLHRKHPGISFLTTLILFAIIFSLLLVLGIVLGERTGLIGGGHEEKKPELLEQIRKHRYSETQRHFHNVPTEDTINVGSKPVCFQCHGELPHSKTPMVRTLLNMHTQFIGCMTCHTDPRKIPEENYQYQWLNYSGIEVTGAPFGTDVNPETGYLVDTDDYYSKIVIYNKEVTTDALIEMTESNKDVIEFLAIKDQLSDQDKDAVKKQFHKQIMTKGRFCSRCHTKEEKSFVPFKKLGFSERRILDVTNLNIVGIVEKYKAFYMPNLFDVDSSLPDTKTMVGSEIGETKIPSEELLKGRSWWRYSNEKTVESESNK
ncbi:MAG: hypothetical protein ABUK13_00220 [Gammaproteobacteria bacterium]